MELDQLVFRWIWRGLRRLRTPRPLWPAAEPGDQLPRLQSFALLLAGRGIQLERASDGIGGRAGDRFYLPFGQCISGALQENLDFFRLRILLMASQPLQRVDAPRLHRLALRRALREFPQARDLYARVKQMIRREESLDRRRPPHAWRPLRQMLCGRYLEISESATAGPGAAIQSQRAAEEEHSPVAALPENARWLTPDQKAIEDYTLGHNFEKIETLDDFDGRWRDLDGEDEQAQHSEALQELQLAWRIRSTEQAQSIRALEQGGAGGGEISGEQSTSPAVFYDEWDFRKRSYRPRHCRLYQRQLSEVRPGYAAQVLQERSAAFRRLERKFAAVFQELQLLHRQLSGDDPDLDALCERFCDLAAGRSPEERLYLSRRRRRKDLSILFLLDLSMSADAWLMDRRVLDVEREALILFGEALALHGCEFAAAAFYSRTRNDCEYLRIKERTEGWQTVRDRLGRLQPEGYTRVGPALRHATAQLRTTPAAQRWLMLITDGRPNDYDRYEGRYGNLDVRQAIREAQAAGIHVQVFAVDWRRRAAFQEMLGQGACQILHDPDQLPEALGDFYLRLLRS
ncbi:MAG: VWA domain-containing protein [Leptospirales bacterium]|nr:VWA domain-containing protein [Leptospirales bacterium]